MGKLEQSKQPIQRRDMIIKLGVVGKGSAHPAAIATLSAIPSDSPWKIQAIQSLGKVVEYTADIDAIQSLVAVFRNAPPPTRTCDLYVTAIESIARVAFNSSE